MSLLLTLNFPIPYLSVSFVDFEQATTVLVNKNNFCNTPLLHTCSRCILVQTLLVYGTISNRCYMESAALIRGEALVRGWCLFWWDLALIRGTAVFQRKTCLKNFLCYLHMCSPSIKFYKTKLLEFAPLEMVIQKVHKFSIHTEILILRQQSFLTTQPQVAPLVIK